MIRLILSNAEALAVLAAMEAWQNACPMEALEAPIGKLTGAGIASPYGSALEAMEARHGPS